MSQYRVGLLIPSSNTTIEPEYYRFGPAGITWHFARLPMVAVAPAEIRAQDSAIEAASTLLAAARPRVVLLCQSSASFVMGNLYDSEVAGRIAAGAACEAMTGAGAMVEALRALGARRIALATPFAAEVLRMTERFFADHGFTPVRSIGLAIAANFDIAGVAGGQLAAMVGEVGGADVDAIVLPGGNMACLAHIARMEQAASCPVVTTNQAGIWAVARRAGIGLDRATLGALAAT